MKPKKHQHHPLPVIYDFPDFSSFLSQWVKQKKHSDASYSYMRLARRIGSDSPSLLTQIGLGRRHPSSALIHKLKSPMELSAREIEYAMALVGFQKAKTLEERRSYGTQLRRLKPRNESVLLDLDRYDLFGKWYVPVILEMVHLADFDENPAWIAARLMEKVSFPEVREAIESCLRLGLLTRDEQGRLTAVAKHLRSPTNIPNESIRNWHRYMMGRASRAMSEQSVQERYVVGTSIAIRSSRLAEAQEVLREFRESFCNEFQTDGDGDAIYQLAFQFFRLTTPVSP